MDYLEISELYHHGIKGQKWGIRRYQNEDGSLTPEGKAKYGTVENLNKQVQNKQKVAQASRSGMHVGSVVGSVGGIALGAKIAKSLWQSSKGLDDLIGFAASSPVVIAGTALATTAIGSIGGATIGALKQKLKNSKESS